MPDLNKAYQWAINMCNLDNVGYSQQYRDMRNVGGITYYDCSSFIWYALIAGGFDCVAANGGSTWPMTTYNEASILTALGFTSVPVSGEWLPGDIGLSTTHTEMVYSGGVGQGVCMGAHTAKTQLEYQVSIGSSMGDPNYVSVASRWNSLWRYGTGGASGGLGCSLYVIAAICGNFWNESNINPGLWESRTVTPWEEQNHGFGLGQWTSVGGNTHGRLWQLHDYLQSHGFADDDPDGQMQFLIVEDYWIPTNAYGHAFDSLSDFLHSNSTDLEYLTRAWNEHWECIPYYAYRYERAKQCFDYILEHKDDPNITSWVIKNDYLTDDEILNNAVMLYRWFEGHATGGVVPWLPPTPGEEKKKRPIWMWIRYY